MVKVQTNSLPLHLETFTQPCAEQRKSLVEQSEEITVELLLEKNDIQPLGDKSRFLVAPLEKEVEIISFLFCYIEFLVLSTISYWFVVYYMAHPTDQEDPLPLTPWITTDTFLQEYAQDEREKVRGQDSTLNKEWHSDNSFRQETYSFHV